MKLTEVPMFHLFQEQKGVYPPIYQKCPEGNWLVRNLAANVWFRFGEPVHLNPEIKVEIYPYSFNTYLPLKMMD
ncbi:MAG: hypothetical protein AAB935_02020 [Patescibacteria group bacterium]